MAILLGNCPVYGGVDPKPLKGFPEGRARIRMRPADFVKVFVKTATGIREFVVTEKDGHWEPLHELARNETR